MKQKFSDISLEIKEPISTLRNWNRILDNVWRDLAYVSNLSRRKQISVHNFWDFYEWYNTPDKKCQYCGITENQLELLNAQPDVINKRNSTRGRSLEIDRKVSSEKYENIKNLAWSCYWCNNAKTDTFTEEEFKIIGKAIGEVWKKRLANAH
jgi:hypothetical protein